MNLLKIKNTKYIGIVSVVQKIELTDVLYRLQFLILILSQFLLLNVTCEDDDRGE